MQSSRWGALKTRFGWEAERVTVLDGDAIVAGAQVLYRSLPLNLGRLAYVPMGPVVSWEDEEQVRALLIALQRTVRQHGAFCLKVEPAVPARPDRAATLASHGFRPSRQTVQWRSTILTDLGCAEEEIPTHFSGGHRRTVRKSAEAGVSVRPGTAADVTAFSELLGSTSDRKQFAVYPDDYYAASYELLGSGGLGHLVVATYEDTPVAGVMVFTLGARAYMLYAASSSAHRELSPGYLAQWEALRWAHAQGCVVYDWCGIPDEVGEDPERYARDARQDGMWGVYRFKRGFGGQVVGYLGTHDQVYNRSLYCLYNHAIDFLENGLGENWNRRLFSG
jgi:lipid II:glycine glycyltransferase (peptidoglycan interpeptide bridge formation enzyme)